MSSRRSRNLADYCRAGLRHKLLLITPVLVLATAAGASLVGLPNLYKSTAIVGVANPKPGESDLMSRLSDFRQQVTSNEVLEAVLAKQASQDQSPENSAAHIRQRISVDAEPQSGSLALSYRAADPEIARLVTSELASRLVTNSHKTGLNAPATSSDELEALHHRATDISSRLRELEANYPRLSVETEYPVTASAQPARNPLPSASAEIARAQQMTIEGLKDQQYKFQQQLADVERRISEQRQIVEQQSKGSGLRGNPVYAALITKRTELQGQRDTLINRQELTDKHPRVLAINDQIEAINRQIEELRRQDESLVGQSPEARELASLSSERNRLKIELEVTGREITRRSSSQSLSPGPEPQSAPSRRETGTSKLAQEYLALTRGQKEVAAQIQDFEARSNKETGASVQLKLEQPADLPISPITPDRPLILAVAVVLGLAIGAVFVLFAESTRFNSLEDARDVEYYTRLPLLATIPKTTTAHERRVARWRKNARIFLGSAAAVALTFALARVFIAADIFSLITKK
jgi:capsular polysaccharide biosynthesis protein